MLRAGHIKWLGSAAILALLAFPSTAAAGATVTGAVHAVIHAVAEEGGNVVYYGTPQVHCRRTTPSHFGCGFFNVTRGLGGRVTVNYTHSHYHVSEPRYEAPREYFGDRWATTAQ